MKPIYIRTISGIVFLMMVVCGVFVKALFPVIFGLFLIVLIYEYHEMTIPNDFLLEKILVGITSVSLFAILTYVRNGSIHSDALIYPLIPFFLSILATLIDSVTRGNVPDSPKNAKIEAIYFPLLYITLPFLSLLYLAYDDIGVFTPLILMNIFLLIWANDIGAYCLGMALGQKPKSWKISETLSPKKSWWGFFGGFVASVWISAITGLFIFPKIPLYHSIALGVIVGIFSLVGDLFESLLKRRAGMKDSGNIMPGHGGLLDRFDSLLFVMPVCFIYLKIAGII